MYASRLRWVSADQSTVGSVFFRIMNVFPKEEAARLLAAYPKELGA